MSGHPADWHRHLQTLRVALDLDLRTAASLCKMSPVVYGQIERGEEDFGPERFAMFARALLKPSRERMQASATAFRARMSDAMKGRR